MNKKFLAIIFFLAANSVFIYGAGAFQISAKIYDKIESEILNPVFYACKVGDLKKKNSIFPKEVITMNKELFVLDENSEYSKFIRRFYQKTNIRIEKLTESGEAMIVELIIDFPDGSMSRHEIFCREEELFEIEGPDGKIKSDRGEPETISFNGIGSGTHYDE
jgi:hypothetical protein